MPSPLPNEPHDDFISRCIPLVIADGAAASPEQAVAVCEGKWESEGARQAATVMTATDAHYIRLSALADTAQIRTASFEDREHIVVPVVALVGDSVVRPLGSTGPEFVPARVLAEAPSGWNGRPTIPTHPGDGLESANSPATLEAMAFGRMFNTTFEDGKLKTEAWLDPIRAKQVGADAVHVIERCQAGEMVEVSIGAWITLEESRGVAPSGEAYDRVWRGITSDHLAMLPAGTTGACSVVDGCGAPRMNQVTDATPTAAATPTATPTANNRQETTHMDAKPNIIARLLAAVGVKHVLRERNLRDAVYAALQEGLSDSDIRNALHAALHDIEPGFDWVVDVFPDSSTVVYTTFTEGADHWYTRSYSVSAKGVAALSDDRVEVTLTTEFVPLASGSDSDSAGDGDGATTSATTTVTTTTATGTPKPCACNNNIATVANNEGDTMSETKAELVGRLIANAATPFDESDRTHLEAAPDERLNVWVKHCAEGEVGNASGEGEKASASASGEEAEGGGEGTADVAPAQADSGSAAITNPPTDTDTATAAPATDTVTLSREEHTNITAAASAWRAQEDRYRTSLISGLKANQTIFDATALTAKSTTELEQLTQLAGAAVPKRDFSGRGLVTAGTAGTSEPPRPYDVALAKSAAKPN